MKNSLRLTAAFVLALPLQSQVEQDVLDRAPWRSAFGLQAEGDQLVGGGPDYRVWFQAGGFEFTPALGADVERTYPIRFRLESIRRSSGTPLALDLNTRPRLAERSARYAPSPGLSERYEVRADGIEQTYVFDSPLAGSGDLIVRGRIETDLELIEEAATGLRFGLLNESGVPRGGVRWGSVTGVDAEGWTSSGSLRWDDGSIELVLPADFVDAASYPLVLDPLIGTEVAIAGTLEDINPDVAYDLTNDTYLVVWERVFAGSDSDIRGQRLTGLGSLLGNLISLEASASKDARDPAVGNVNLTDRFLVVWEQANTAPLFIPDIYGRSCNPATGGLSATTLIASDFASLIDPDVGGDSTTTDDDAIVVYIEIGSGCRGAQVTVPAIGVPNTISTVTLTTEGAAREPTLPKSGGPAGRYLVAWTLDPSFGLSHVQGRVITRNGGLLTPIYDLAGNMTRDVRSPDVDGDGTNFMLVWQRAEAPGSADDDILAQAYYYYTDLVAIQASAVVEADAFDDEQHPKIGFTGESYIITWEDGTGVGDYDVYALVADPFDCSTCEPKVAVALGSSLDQTGLAIAPRFAGGPSAQDDALIVWGSRPTTSATSNIVGRRYRTETGQVTDLGGGCGLGGRAYVSCAQVGEWVHHRLYEAETLRPSFLIISFERLNYTAGGCTLVPNPFSAFVIPAVGNTGSLLGNWSEATFLPDNPALVGVTFYEQWAVATSSPVFSAIGADLSNALEVVIE